MHDNVDQLTLIPAPIALFMYKPVLYRLQSMPLVPFAEEVDFSSREKLPLASAVPHQWADEYRWRLMAEAIRQCPPRFPGLDGTLDEGQKKGMSFFCIFLPHSLPAQPELITGPKER